MDFHNNGVGFEVLTPFQINYKQLGVWSALGPSRGTRLSKTYDAPVPVFPSTLIEQDPAPIQKRQMPIQSKIQERPEVRLDRIFNIVKEKFSYDLRTEQEVAIRHLLAGHDTVYVSGTGSGKSLVYQAMSFAKKKGVVLVISPLVGLIEDQVRHF